MICYALAYWPTLSQPVGLLNSFRLYDDVGITIDLPFNLRPKKEQLIIFYALPNGNTTQQTMGKKTKPGDDWHFDIQHIKAQTQFIRKELPRKNVIVVYLENNYKSWPQWKTKHPHYTAETQHLIDTVLSLFSGKKTICFNGHSGGGRFIFNYLDGIASIPAYVGNISFIDSNYGYEPDYLLKIVDWLKQNKKAHLNVFAYNDSVALLDGKRVVSDTGGTWYRSHLMLHHLGRFFRFDKIRDDSLVIFRSVNKKITFNLKTNPDKIILHTQQVERNGFIHSILTGTKKESKHYTYFGERAYLPQIE